MEVVYSNLAFPIAANNKWLIGNIAEGKYSEVVSQWQSSLWFGWKVRDIELSSLKLESHVRMNDLSQWISNAKLYVILKPAVYINHENCLDFQSVRNTLLHPEVQNLKVNQALRSIQNLFFTYVMDTI